ncbi:MAG: methionine--tRNA ligase [archaeon]
MIEIKSRRILVTSALPYANGSLHMGHLCSTYLPADIFVRYHRAIGNDVVYVCATDEHGTPIEINAQKAGLKPEEFVKKFRVEHAKDFSLMGISFDIFYHTHSPENKEFAALFFERAKKKGVIYTKEVELMFCPDCERYLPDRFLKGTCPKCGAADQYGDSCEKCGATYQTSELVDAYCAVCGAKPEKRTEEHYFFKLKMYEKELRKWLTSNKKIQKDVKNYVLNWIKEGLKDWDITRTGPYFGFLIPGEKNKYFYVWLDAPVGYVSSTAKWAKDNKRKWEDFWLSKDSSIYHFIGKDIVYFHFLFWPALLMAADFNLPTDIPTRGYLTVDKDKMSKSRGTFILLRDYLDKFPADYLRYFLTSVTANNTTDTDFSYKEFQMKVNNELSDTFGNFAHRTLTFACNNFGSSVPRCGKMNKVDKEFDKRIEGLSGVVGDLIEDVELKRAQEEIMEFSRECNRYFNSNEPWKTVKTDKERAATTVYLSLKALFMLANVLSPFVPTIAASLGKTLGVKDTSWGKIDFKAGAKLKKPEVLVAEVTDEDIAEDPFSALDLRVAKVLSVEDHPQADKLYVVQIDLGAEKRQLVAGLREHVAKVDLVGKNIVVVANLEYAKLRGVESQGMLLAADDGKDVVALTVAGEPGESVVASGVARKPKEKIKFNDFLKIEMLVNSRKEVEYKGKVLKSEKGSAVVGDIGEGAKVR